MGSLLLLVFLQATNSCCATPEPAGPPTITVQAVDPYWLPVPGVEITVTPARKGGKAVKATTDSRGVARFWLEPQAEYTVEARLEGFKTRRIKGVRTHSSKHGDFVPQVQIKLDLSGRPEEVQ
jgi:hypothetical protein